jgi:hypothetical protein
MNKNLQEIQSTEKSLILEKEAKRNMIEKHWRGVDLRIWFSLL